jgi:thiol-disulfide isomerase/thioredoxin
MNEARRTLVFGTGVAVACAAAGIGVSRWRSASNPDTRSLWALALASPDGSPRRLVDWRGKPLLVNFWATWCEPCREEMPLLVATADRGRSKGLEVIGIGIDDAAKIREFAANYRITYPLLVAGPEAIEVSRRLGNSAGGLPYTVALSSAGDVVASHLGALTPARLAEISAKLLS